MAQWLRDRRGEEYGGSGRQPARGEAVVQWGDVGHVAAARRKGTQWRRGAVVWAEGRGGGLKCNKPSIGKDPATAPKLLSLMPPLPARQALPSLPLPWRWQQRACAGSAYKRCTSPMAPPTLISRMRSPMGTSSSCSCASSTARVLGPAAAASSAMRASRWACGLMGVVIEVLHRLPSRQGRVQDVTVAPQPRPHQQSHCMPATACSARAPLGLRLQRGATSTGVLTTTLRAACWACCCRGIPTAAMLATASRAPCWVCCCREVPQAPRCSRPHRVHPDGLAVAEASQPRARRPHCVPFTLPAAGAPSRRRHQDEQVCWKPAQA